MTERIMLSDEVLSTNPFSRLMALKRMGIVENYEKITEITIVIVGLGGIGSTAAEMLVRCGVGKLILFDYDTVEMANMNRLFYKPKHCGLYKVEAAKRVLQKINSCVEIDTYCTNITSINNFDEFLYVLKNGGRCEPRVNLVLSCVDNYQARMTVNSACNELNQVWIESGVSENAVSGHVQFIIPGKTACYACVPPLLVASNIDESSLKKDGVCAASLPTTMSIIAGLLVQNALKYLLNFGEISKYISYNALSDYFNRFDCKPNDDCYDVNCRKLKMEHDKMEMLVDNGTPETDEPTSTPAENPWNIEILHDVPSLSCDRQPMIIEESTQPIEELMNRLKDINS